MTIEALRDWGQWGTEAAPEQDLVNHCGLRRLWIGGEVEEDISQQLVRELWGDMGPADDEYRAVEKENRKPEGQVSSFR